MIFGRKSLPAIENRELGDGLFLQAGGAELFNYTDPAEFLQRPMQPQLLWGTNNPTPSGAASDRK
jgi:hypothetical protein